MRDLDLWGFDFLKNPVHDKQTPRTLQSYDLITDAATLSWVQDGLTKLEDEAVRFIYGSSFLWPSSTEALLEKSWLTDGVTRYEVSGIDSFRRVLHGAGILMLWDPDRMRWLPRPNTWREALDLVEGPDRVGVGLLSMPFLASYEGFEELMLVTIKTLFGKTLQSLEDAVSHFTSNGGLTDNQVLRHIYELDYRGTFILDIQSLQQLDQYLGPADSAFYGANIYQQRFSVDHAGSVLLIVVSEYLVSPHTIHVLAETVREVERAMGVAFPYGHVLTLLGTNPGIAYSTNHIQVDVSPALRRNPQEIVLRRTRALVHEISHAYFHDAARWVLEGATTFLTALILDNISSEEAIWNTSCPTQKIAEIVHGAQYESSSHCAYHLGADLFLDLYRSLGAPAFWDGFRRLHSILIEDESFSSIPQDCCGNVEPGLYYVRRAFVTEAPPEVAAIAEPIILHRYYVGDR